MVNELGVDPAKLVAVLHFDGTPITARFIIRKISDHVAQALPAATANGAHAQIQDTEAA